MNYLFIFYDNFWQVDLPLWIHCSHHFKSELMSSRPSPQLKSFVFVMLVVMMFLLLSMGVLF